MRRRADDWSSRPVWPAERSCGLPRRNACRPLRVAPEPVKGRAPRHAYDDAVFASNVEDVALVFEGGGMRASHSAGVLTAILDAGVHCNWVGGISAGSSCTVNYLVRDRERARRSFVEIAGDPRFGDWRTFVRGKGAFHAEWIYEHTSEQDQPLPFDFDTFQSNPAEFRIGAYRCDDGAMTYFGRDEVSAKQDLMKCVRASSSMPLLMPNTEVDGTIYCDGALGPSGGIPLDAAQADGKTRFIVVLTRARGYRKEPFKYAKAFRRIFARYPAIADGMAARADNYNNTMAELLELESEGRALLIFPEEMPIKNSERDLAKLRAMYDTGVGLGWALTPQLKEFCGL